MSNLRDILRQRQDERSEELVRLVDHMSDLCPNGRSGDDQTVTASRADDMQDVLADIQAIAGELFWLSKRPGWLR